MRLYTVITLMLSVSLAPHVRATAIAAVPKHPAHMLMHGKRAISNDAPILCTETLITTEIVWTTTTVFYSQGQYVPSNSVNTFMPTVQTVLGQCSSEAASINTSTMLPINAYSPANVYPSTYPSAYTSAISQPSQSLAQNWWQPSTTTQPYAWTGSTFTPSTSTYVAPILPSTSTAYGVPTSATPTAPVPSGGQGTTNTWCTSGWGATSGAYSFMNTPELCGTCTSQCAPGAPCSGPFSVFDTSDTMFCGYSPITEDMLVVAVPMMYMGDTSSYGTNQPRDPNCNRQVNLEILGQSAVAYVVDRCGSCGGTGLDLSNGVYKKLNLPNPYPGPVPVGTWHFID